MRITLSRSFRVNMGNYEHFEMFASVTMGHEDLGITTDEMATEAAKRPKYTEEVYEELKDSINNKIDDLIKDDIDQAKELTVADNSFLRRL